MTTKVTTNLYEILVPTVYGDTFRPISTRHHKSWDKVVRKLAGGLTIHHAAKGQWVHQDDLFEERVLPVRIACSPEAMGKIVTFTLTHYRQIAVMYYLLSTECHTVYNDKRN